MRAILVLLVSFACLGFSECGHRTIVMVPAERVIQDGRVYVATQTDGSECIIRADDLMNWAKGVPGADRVYHERYARVRVEGGPYYKSLMVCEASESAGSSRGSPSIVVPSQNYYPYTDYHNRRY